MANALVSFMLQKLDKVYLDYIQQRVTLIVGVEEDVQTLKTTFKVIQAVLSDAELRQIKDDVVKLWLQEFKDIAYDMDDVLDEWSFEMHRSQIDIGEGNNKKKVISSYLCSLCSCFTKVALRHNIGTKIKDIKEKLNQAVMNNNYGLVKITSNEKPIESLPSSSLIQVSDVLGRITDKETIMNKLMFLGESSTSTTQLETSSTQALQAPNIISIVGMGGLGKTTLAQLVFNEVQVIAHFDITMWVCVSNHFDRVTVTKAIIEAAQCEVPKSCSWNTLHHSLSESIKGKKFLLLLDDVWTDDRFKWEPLEICLRNNIQGSRILVTTRNERVALMMNTTYTHFLGKLSNGDCSSLLNRIALAGRKEENNHKELKEIGEKIAEMCQGLPLAAKTLGGLLHFKKSKREWDTIFESEIWKLEEVEKNDFLKPALLLSYYDLSIPLKGCFGYCSIFPKDHTLRKDVLVNMWMAQGFLKSISGNEDLEGIGEDYFNNLAMRSFFQDISKDKIGNIISCKMHDLVHDLAEYLTENECLTKNEGSVKHNNGTQILDFSRVRHLTIVCEKELGHSAVCNAKKLRTLQIVNGRELTIKEAHVDLFHHRFRCLKVLCLNDIGLENLSGEIENLIHLRYLDLSHNYKLKILPDTISNLYNLQTLKLEMCQCLGKLPREMWKMINLRHLDISNTYALRYIPQGIGGLTSLRTLSEFIVGGASEGCKISELKNLNLLQGCLRIWRLGRVETVNDAVEMELKHKKLHTLRLGFQHNEERESGLLPKRMEDVLDVLEPHPDVVELVVDDYLGFKLSNWIGSTSFLTHMKTLGLYGCINLTKFPAFGQLPSLEVLDIKRAINVKHIGFEFYSNNNLEHVNKVPFPKLKELYMEEMINLEVWELQHGVVMPCLRLIEVRGCRKLKALPALGKLPSLEVLVIKRVDELRHVGCEFLYEVDDEEEEAAGGEVRFNNTIAFPKLKSLMGPKELEWEFGGLIAGGGGSGVIMPCLRELEIGGFRNSKPFVEILSKMASLEFLRVSGEVTEFIEYIGQHDGIILFPNLKSLKLFDMKDMEELKIGFQVMPLLNSLTIANCNKLKAIQGVGGSLSKLESLELGGCASLNELPFPNLQALEVLRIDCGNHIWTCVPEQVQQLTSLKRLQLYDCSDELEQRCRKEEGEDWKIISHIPNIRINLMWITAAAELWLL